MTNNNIKSGQQISQTELARDDIARQMLQVWASAMPTDHGLSISNERKTILNLLFGQVFDYNLERWEKFIDLIVGSVFLQTKLCKSGELFDLAIEPMNCLTILDSVQRNDTGFITEELAESLIAKGESQRKSQS